MTETQKSEQPLKTARPSTFMHNQVQSNLAKYQAPPESVENLLDPRALGWILLEEWPGLFLLFERNGEFRVDLSVELQRRVNTLRRGHSLDDELVITLETALFQAAIVAGVLSEKPGHSSNDLNTLRTQIADGIIRTLGTAIFGIFAEKDQGRAKSKKSAAADLVQRALDGILRIKWPSRARGSGARIPREIIAIEYAHLLCQQFHRLPRKSELRANLEAASLGYSPRSKGLLRKWQLLFSRAGLEDLPD